LAHGVCAEVFWQQGSGTVAVAAIGRRGIEPVADQGGDDRDHDQDSTRVQPGSRRRADDGVAVRQFMTRV
jgi:hypothetical protein